MEGIVVLLLLLVLGILIIVGVRLGSFLDRLERKIDILVRRSEHAPAPREMPHAEALRRPERRPEEPREQAAAPAADATPPGAVPDRPPLLPEAARVGAPLEATPPAARAEALSTGGPASAPSRSDPLRARDRLRDARGSGPDLEAAIGQRWLVRVGALLLVIGMGFLFKWSVEHGYLSREARVALGGAGGLALWALAERFFRRGYVALAQGFFGCGSALLMLSLFAAHALYGLVGPTPAFAGMAVVSAATAAMAVRRRALALALLAQLGALLTPLLITTPASDRDVLYGYLALVSAAFLAVSHLRRWESVRVVAWLGCVFLLLSDDYARIAAGWPATLWSSAIALLFLGGFLGGVLFGGAAASASTMPLVAANAAWWLIRLLAHANARPDDARGLGIALVAAALVHLALAEAVRRRAKSAAQPAPGALVELLRMIGAILLLLAPQIAYGAPATHFAWTACGALFAAAGRAGRSPTFQGAAVMAVFLGISGALFDANALGSASELRTGLGAAVLAGVAAALHPRMRAVLAIGAAITAAATVLAVTGLREPWAGAGGLDAYLPAMGIRFAALGAGAAAAMVVFARAFHSAFYVPTALAMAVAFVFYAVALDSVQEPPAWLFLNVRSVSLLLAPLACLALGRMLLRKPAEIPAAVAGRILVSAGVIAPLPLLCFDAARFFAHRAGAEGFVMTANAAVSVTCTAYAALLLAIGIGRRLRALRIAALALFGFTLVKVVVYDLANLAQIYRIVSFLALGVVLMAVAWLYHRFEKRLFPAAPGGE